MCKNTLLLLNLGKIAKNKQKQPVFNKFVNRCPIQAKTHCFHVKLRLQKHSIWSNFPKAVKTDCSHKLQPHSPKLGKIHCFPLNFGKVAKISENQLFLLIEATLTKRKEKHTGSVQIL